MREYVLFVILIFIPIGLALHYFLRREGLPEKDTNIILALALLIIFTFPICMARLGIYISMLIYLLVISILVAYLLGMGESSYLAKALASLRSMRLRPDLVGETDITGLTYEEATNLLLGSLENTAREMLGPAPAIEHDIKNEDLTVDEPLPIELGEVAATTQTGENEVSVLAAERADALEGKAETTEVLFEAEREKAIIEEPLIESEVDSSILSETAAIEEMVAVYLEEPAVNTASENEEAPAEAITLASEIVAEVIEDTVSEVVDEAAEPVREVSDIADWTQEIVESEVRKASAMSTEEAAVPVSGEDQPDDVSDGQSEEVEIYKAEVTDHYEAISEELESAEVFEAPEDIETAVAEADSIPELVATPVDIDLVKDEEEENEAVCTEAGSADSIEAAAEDDKGVITELELAARPVDIDLVKDEEKENEVVCTEAGPADSIEVAAEDVEGVITELELAARPVDIDLVKDEEKENEVVCTEAGPADSIEVAAEDVEGVITEFQSKHESLEISGFFQLGNDLVGDTLEEDHEIEEPDLILLEAAPEEESIEEDFETTIPLDSSEATVKILAEEEIDNVDHCEEETDAISDVTEEEIELTVISKPVEPEEITVFIEAETEEVIEEMDFLPVVEDEALLESARQDFEPAEETELPDDHETVVESMASGEGILETISEEPLAVVEFEDNISEQLSVEQDTDEESGMLSGEHEEEAASEHNVEQTDVAASGFESAEVNRWIDEGFRFKAMPDLPAAIYAFVQAWNSVEDNELKYLITLELVELYKECGYYNYAEQVLGNYLELGGHKSDIIYEINRQLEAVRFLATELTRLGMSGAPWAQVPRWIRMELEDALNQ